MAMVKKMRWPPITNDKLGIVLLLVVCVSLAAIVFFVLAPYLRDTVSLATEYGATPDTWVYYVVLAGCGLVFIASLFLLFRHYLRRPKEGPGRGVPEG
jgi:H+/Cl- antiporter ClcA